MFKIGPYSGAALFTLVLGLAQSALPFAPGAGAALAQTGAPTQAAASTTALDPAAMTVLKRMCDRLQAARTFTVRGRASLELPVAGGELATFFNEFDISVRRPDGLAAHRKGDLQEFLFAFDGKAMTVHVPAMGEWGTTSAPGTIDAMLVAAGEQGGLNMPFDELMVADPYAAITAGLTAAVNVGQAGIRGKKVEHLVLSSAQFRVEYWIDPATALPVRSLVVYVDHPVRPHFGVEYEEWKLDSKLPASAFALPKPQGATQVEFSDAAKAFR